MEKIDSSDIVAFKPFSVLYPVLVDPVYARSDHPENVFGQIYDENATIWGHRDLVKIVLLASKRLQEDRGWTLTVKDCLRPVEAQLKMIETPIVRAHPHWLEEPRFLSGPGQGGHPRGMAVDIAVDGVDFGTGFDHFAASTKKDVNPAHRAYPPSSPRVRENRDALEKALMSAARDFSLPLLPLPQEWWDFRFPQEYTKNFAALSDDDLGPAQKMMTDPARDGGGPDERTLEELSRFAV